MIVFNNFIAGGLNKVGFTKTGSSINKERVIFFTDVFRNGDRSGVSQFIGRADDKTFKGVSGMEICFRISRQTADFFLLGGERKGMFLDGGRNGFATHPATNHNILNSVDAAVYLLESLQNYFIVFALNPFFGKIIINSYNNHSGAVIFLYQAAVSKPS